MFAARLPAGDDRTQAELGGVEALLLGAARQVVRIGSDREDPVGAKRREQVEQPLALAEPDRDDRRPGRLERHVVGDPARVEGVVDAVQDGLVGAHARCPKSPGAGLRRALEIAAGEPDQERRPRRAGGDVQPDDPLAVDAGDGPERRVLGLGREQFGLRRERQGGKILERPDGRVAEPLGVERRAGADVRDLHGQRLLLRAALGVERKPLDIGVDVAAGCDHAILTRKPA
jgi:hypothetical protein